jgi:hypothetical protein
MLVDVIVSVTTNKTPEQIQSIFDEKIYLGYKIDDNDNELLCSSLIESNKENWVKKYILYFHLIYENQLICENTNKNIIALSLDNGLELWQFSISDFPPYIDLGRQKEAEIKQILGVFDNILWVHISAFWLIGIDIETGKLVHKIENVMRGDSSHNFLDTTNGVIKTLVYNCYTEFDLKTLQFSKQIIVQNKENIRFRASNFYENDKYLYFCGYCNDDFYIPNVFGIFDTEKAKIVWYETTKDDLGYFYNPPQANDKLLAILDDKHNLLIYERDELK